MNKIIKKLSFSLPWDQRIAEIISKPFIFFNIHPNIVTLIGILFGHLIFGVALTQLLDWTWLKNLMSEEDKTRMLKSYTWKDLLVDGAIVTVVLGIIFLIISIFL